MRTESIRKYRSDEIDRKLIEEIVYSATFAPCRQKPAAMEGSIVYQGEKKDKLVEVMRHGIQIQKKSPHELMPEWAFAIPDAEQYSQNHAGGAVTL
ncbi:MAG: hypothetical protein ACLR78_06235 [Roseburia sp.]